MTKKESLKKTKVDLISSKLKADSMALKGLAQKIQNKIDEIDKHLKELEEENKGPSAS